MCDLNNLNNVSTEREKDPSDIIRENLERALSEYVFADIIDDIDAIATCIIAVSDEIKYSHEYPEHKFNVKKVRKLGKNIKRLIKQVLKWKNKIYVKKIIYGVEDIINNLS
jgi:hypothetical protein